MRRKATAGHDCGRGVLHFARPAISSRLRDRLKEVARPVISDVVDERCDDLDDVTITIDHRMPEQFVEASRT